MSLNGLHNGTWRDEDGRLRNADCSLHESERPTGDEAQADLDAAFGLDNGAPRVSSRQAKAPRLQWVDAGDVKPLAVEWFIDQRIPAGMVMGLAGVQGDGKSMFIASIVAQKSAGVPFGITPNIPNKPGKCIVVATEDSFEHTLVPRLKAHGANIANIRLLNEVMDVDGSERPFFISRDRQRRTRRHVRQGRRVPSARTRRQQRYL